MLLDRRRSDALMRQASGRGGKGIFGAWLSSRRRDGTPPRDQPAARQGSATSQSSTSSQVDGLPVQDASAYRGSSGEPDTELAKAGEEGAASVDARPPLAPGAAAGRGGGGGAGMAAGRGKAAAAAAPAPSSRWSGWLAGAYTVAGGWRSPGCGETPLAWVSQCSSSHPGLSAGTALRGSARAFSKLSGSEKYHDYREAVRRLERTTAELAGEARISSIRRWCSVLKVADNLSPDAHGVGMVHAVLSTAASTWPTRLQVAALLCVACVSYDCFVWPQPRSWVRVCQAHLLAPAAPMASGSSCTSARLTRPSIQAPPSRPWPSRYHKSLSCPLAQRKTSVVSRAVLRAKS